MHINWVNYKHTKDMKNNVMLIDKQAIYNVTCVNWVSTKHHNVIEMKIMSCPIGEQPTMIHDSRQ